jgi:hypothetical protein
MLLRKLFWLSVTAALVRCNGTVTIQATRKAPKWQGAFTNRYQSNKKTATAGTVTKEQENTSNVFYTGGVFFGTPLQKNN